MIGVDPSVILGRLTSNGVVFLVNSNGVLFGPGSKIDVGSLIATTAGISNENFMAGRYRFDQVTNRFATVINRGEITRCRWRPGRVGRTRGGEHGDHPRQPR